MTELFRPNDVRAVALDWDGTVVNTVPFKIAQNLALAHEFGNNLTEEEVRREWNACSGFPDLMQRLTGSADEAAVEAAVLRDYDKPEFAKREFPFAKTALRTIGRRGLGLSLATNLTRKMLTLDTNLLNFNLEHYFEFTQTVNEYPFKKPDGRVLDPTRKHFGVKASKLLYVGDEMKDYKTALDAGSQFIGVTSGMTTPEEFADLDIPYTGNLAGVAELLRTADSRA